MNYVTGVGLAIAAVIIVLSVLVQVSQYRRGEQIISSLQLALRLLMAVLLLSIIGLSFFGAIYFRTHPQPLPEMIFWSMLVLLAMVVIVLALVDLRRVRRTQHQARAELYQRMADLQKAMQAGVEDKQADSDESR